MNSEAFLILPPEILEKIFSYLALEELLACSEVCSSWYQVTNSTKLWKKFAITEDLIISPSELRDCDAIRTNFSNKFIGVKKILPATLTPVNIIKLYIKQRNFLKHNWSHGLYVFHVLQQKDCRFEKFGKVFYPSKSPQDCLYYPILGTRKYGRVDLYLVRLDKKPRIVYKLINNVRTRTETYPLACVMRDYVVWSYGNKVQCLDLTGNLNNSKVQTLVTLVINEMDDCVDDTDYEIYVTMDANYILAVCTRFFYVWCKKTFEIRYSRDVPDDGIDQLNGYPYLEDGFLIIPCSREDEEFTTFLEVYNLRNMFKREFTLEGVCTGLSCSKDTIVIQYMGTSAEDKSMFIYIDLFNYIVLDKSTLKMKFSHTGSWKFEPLCTVVNEYLHTHDPRSGISTLRNLTTGEKSQRKVSSFIYEGHDFLFDSIVVKENNDGRVEVWDWMRDVKLYSIYTVSTEWTEPPRDCGMWARLMRKLKTDTKCGNLPSITSTRDTLIHVSETRMVTLNHEGSLKVYGFG